MWGEGGTSRHLTITLCRVYRANGIFSYASKMKYPTLWKLHRLFKRMPFYTYYEFHCEYVISVHSEKLGPLGSFSPLGFGIFIMRMMVKNDADGTWHTNVGQWIKQGKEKWHKILEARKKFKG